tara:strand:+ start:74181 stop:74633 length:453 start_codon:yes stop_codon:yes gene_type:complete
MHLKLPPLFIALITCVLMYFLALFLPFGVFDFTGKKYMMFFLLGLGCLLEGFSLFQFFFKKTTISPISPDNASTLVVNGIYNFTRNPMYLGMLLLLLAFGLYLGNAFNILVAAGFVSYMNNFQIIPEEEALEKKFGEAYKNYRIKVRRWF